MRLPFFSKVKFKEEILEKEQTNPKKALMSREVTESRSMLYEKSQFDRYNPSELFQKRGNYDLYDRMREDDQIRAILNFKKSIIVGSEWYIDSQDKDVAEFWDKALSENYNQLDGSTFDNALFEILSAIDYGFSLTEIIIKSELVGSKLGWVLKKLKTRAPHSFEIVTKNNGDIEKIIQIQSSVDKEIPIEKLLLFTYLGEFGNPYGTSDLNLSVYRSYWSKDNIIKFWNIMLERDAMRFYVGKFPSGMADDASLDTFEKTLKNIQAKSSAIIDSRYEIEEFAGDSKGGSAYKDAVLSHNLMIARAMLMPDLLGLSGEQNTSGGLGGKLGETQFNLFLSVMSKQRKELLTLINNRIIKPLTKLNFGKDTEAEIKFREMTKDQEYMALGIFNDFVQKTGHAPNIEQKTWAMDVIGVPTAKMIEDDELKIKEQAKDPDPTNPKKVEPGAVLPEPQPKLAGPIIAPKKVAAVTPPKEEVKPNKMSEEQDEFNRKFTRFEEKVNFTKIDNDLDSVEEKYMPVLGQDFKAIFNNLKTDIEKRKIIENKKFNLINDLKIKGKGQLKKDFEKLLKASGQAGINSSTGKSNFAIFDTDPALNNEDIALWLKEYVPYFVDQESETLLKIAKGTLMDGIRSGAGVQETMKMLEEEFAKWGFEEYETGPRLENIVRTNTSKGFNQARAAEFTKQKEMISGYQFSAILDSRTSEICQRLDTKVLKPDEMDKYNPPVHYQCRSLLVPVFVDELADEGETLKDFKNVNTVNVSREKGGFLKLN